MASDIDRLRNEIDVLRAQLTAQQTALIVIVTVIGDIEPRAKADIMKGLAAFERGARRMNEQAEVLLQMRAFREAVEAVVSPGDSSDDERSAG